MACTNILGVDIISFELLPFTYIVIYRSPSSSKEDFFQALSNMLNTVDGPFLLVGDINIDLNTNVLTGPGRRFVEMMQEKNAISLTMFDEISTDGNSHIDVAFSNYDNIESWYYESYYSYHKPICTLIKK